MGKHVRLVMFVAAAALTPVAAAAQTPPAQPPPQAAPAPAGQTQPAEPPATPAYAYQVEGRRDPFVSLLGRGLDPKGQERQAGLPGMLINEVSVKGVWKSREGFSALIQGPDNRTYPARAGDKLLDGTIKAITAEVVVFSQDVNDPLSVVKQREVIKKVRQNEEGRE